MTMRATQPSPTPVTLDTFVRAESDMYLGGILKDAGGAIGKFNHRREVAPVDHQTAIHSRETSSTKRWGESVSKALAVN